MLQCIFSWEPIALRLRWFLRQLVKAIKAIQFFGGDRVGAPFGTSPIIQAGEKLSSALVLKPSHVIVDVFFAVFNFA